MAREFNQDYYKATLNRPIPGESLYDDPDSPSAYEGPTKFTTIQKTHTINDISQHKTFIPASKAWGFHRNSRGVGEWDEKSVMVFLADETMFDKIPPLMMNAINEGHWSGEFVVVCQVIL